MFTEPTITWVPSGFSGYIWLDTKIVLKKKNQKQWGENTICLIIQIIDITIKALVDVTHIDYFTSILK